MEEEGEKDGERDEEKDRKRDRKRNLKKPKPSATRGYEWMSSQHILQADEGCDFDFLETSFGRTAKEPDIF